MFSKSSSPYPVSELSEAWSDHQGIRRRTSSSDDSQHSSPSGYHIVNWGHKERGPQAPHRSTRRVTNDDLQEAVLRGDLRLVRELCLAGASVNAPLRPLCDPQFMSVLHILACNPNVPNASELINFTVRQRADVDARSSYGATPLIFACLYKHVAVAEALLKNEASNEAIDDYGRNPLHSAMILGVTSASTDINGASVQLVRLLHKHGADLSYGGITPPVTEGVLQGNDRAVSALLELGAKPEGLHEAVNQSHIGIIKLLVDHEANPFLHDSKGMDVMEIAIARGDLEISNLIRDYMGKLERDKHPHLKTRKSVQREEESYDRAAKIIGKSKGSGVVKPPTPIRLFMTRFGQECRKVGKNGFFQKLMIAALFAALFLPDVCIIFMVTSQVFQDVAVMIIFFCFSTEYFVLVFGSWNSYVGSFYFWTDIIGLISVPLDHSLVQENIMPDQKGMDNSMLVRTTRMIRLGTRAGRFTKLVKLLRFLPGMGGDDSTASAAQGVSARINGKISILVSCLIIVMIMLLPIFDLFRYPTDDLSMRVWVETLDDAVSNHAESLASMLQDVENFYFDMQYFPLTVEANFPNGTLFQYTLDRRVSGQPTREDDYLEFATGRVRMVFNFEAPNRAESIRNCVLIVSILIFMTGAASNVSKEVSRIVLKPLDELLGVVKNIASNIFTSVVQMSNSLSIDDDYSKDEEEAEEDVFQQETLILQVVLKKLSALSMIMLSGGPMNEEAYSKLSAADRELLECLTGGGSVNATEEWTPPKVTWETGCCGAEQLLADKGVSVADIETWSMNVMDFSNAQARAVALAIIVIAGDRVEPKESSDQNQAVHGAERAPGSRSGSPTFCRTISPTSQGSTMELRPAIEIAVSLSPEAELRAFENVARPETTTPTSLTQYRTDSATPQTVISAMAGENWQVALFPFKVFIHDVVSEYPPADVIPYHNWRHGIDVMFTVYRMLCMCSATDWMTLNERFAVIISALAHDVAYPGYNNSFLTETSHEIAMRYNDHSPNEHMHAARMFEIANRPQCRIFDELDEKDYRLVRHYCVEAILNTDNLRHFSLLAELQMLYDSDRAIMEKSHRLQESGREPFPSAEMLEVLRDPSKRGIIRSSLLHFCDISNPMKPWALCWVWANLILEEFCVQGDKEKELGIPVQHLNDRSKVNLPYSQIGFIEFFVAPFTSLTAKILLPMSSVEVFLWNNLDTWVEEWISKSMPDEEERDRVNERVLKIKKAGFQATQGRLSHKAV